LKLSGDFLFGDGMAAQARYSGVVDKVEVAFAAEEQTLQWPFRLTDLSMGGKPAGIVRDTTPDFRPYTVQALRRDVPRANPFELSFDRAQAFFTTRLDFTLRSPALPNFERAFTVGRLQLQRVELKDGTTLTPPTGTAVRFGTAAKDGVLTRRSSCSWTQAVAGCDQGGLRRAHDAVSTNDPHAAPRRPDAGPARRGRRHVGDGDGSGPPESHAADRHRGRAHPVRPAHRCRRPARRVVQSEHHGRSRTAHGASSSPRKAHLPTRR